MVHNLYPILCSLFINKGLSRARLLRPGSTLIFTGHVIPAEHLLAVALDRGPSGKELDFTYQSRDSAQLVSQCLAPQEGY